MLIPHWLVLGFAWIICLTIGAGLLALCSEIVIRCVKHAFKAADEVLAAFGALAAFYNFCNTILKAADGGDAWVNSFIHPKDPNWRNRFDKRNWRIRNPSLYFQIVPHPEAWRWWMKWLGIKKPQPKG